MTPGSRASANSDAYAALLARLQPRSIRSEEEARRIQDAIDALVDQAELSPAEQEMLSLLGDLMLAWEQDRYELPAVSPAETIRALLEAHGLRQGDLVGAVFPTKSVASAVLTGRRRLTYEHVDMLAHFFHVSPAAFYASDQQAGVA